jgi:hypothetical protein
LNCRVSRVAAGPLLREESTRLKHLVAVLTPDKHGLAKIVRKKSLKPARRREFVGWMRSAYGASLSRVCRVAQISRSLCACRSRRIDPVGLKRRLRELAHSQPRFGYRRLQVMPPPEGWVINMRDR